MRYDRIVFVCEDNSCLSILAENVFIGRYKGEPIYVASRGIVVLFEAPCNPRAEEILRRNGIEPVRTTTMEIGKRDITDSTLVITLKESDRQRFHKRFPYADAIALGTLSGEQCDVTDPYGKGREAYEECFEDIVRMMNKAMPQIYGLLNANDEFDSNLLFEKEIMEEDTKDDSFRM